jgi:nucleotide-binding universal stress UspA family protein
MTRTLLIAVHDSAAAFAAADVAMGLAARLGDSLHAVMVTETDPGAATTPDEIRGSRAAPVFAHLAARAELAGIPLTTEEASGTVARVVLDRIEAVHAEFVVVAATDRPGSAIPQLGSHTLSILEFSPIPVLVVPAPSEHRPGAGT